MFIDNKDFKSIYEKRFQIFDHLNIGAFVTTDKKNRDPEPKRHAPHGGLKIRCHQPNLPAIMLFHSLPRQMPPAERTASGNGMSQSGNLMAMAQGIW